MANFENIQSFLQAPSEGASPSPIGDFPTLRNLYASGYALGKPGLREATGFAQKQNAYEDKLRAAAEKKARDKAEGVGFERVPKDDGGYDFFDNEGNSITAQEFARAKKMRLEDALEGSYSQQDINYLNDSGQVKYISQIANEVSRYGQDEKKALRQKQQNALRKLEKDEELSEEEKLDENEKQLLEYMDDLEKINNENPGVSDLTQQQLVRNLIKTYPSIFQSTQLPEEEQPQSGFGIGKYLGDSAKSVASTVGPLGSLYNMFRRR